MDWYIYVKWPAARLAASVLDPTMRRRARVRTQALSSTVRRRQIGCTIVRLILRGVAESVRLCDNEIRELMSH
jgi:hypothetical protein